MNKTSNHKPRTTRKRAACSSVAKQSSSEAGRRAAVILEVLAGIRRPLEAAAVLKISVNHYYLLERKAMAGLLAACEPRPKGPRPPGPERQVALLQRELEACQRECQRQAALVRATQRAVGVPAAAMSKSQATAAIRKRTGKGKRRRRPVVRALTIAKTLRENSSGPDSANGLEQPLDADTREASSTPVAEQERHSGTDR